MQISIQSLEITHNRVPYRFLVKKVHNSSNNEIRFHCWAPEDNFHAKELIKGDVLLFEWDYLREDLKPCSDNPLTDKLRQAIRENFLVERA